MTKPAALEARYRYMTETPIPLLIGALSVPTIISMMVTNLYNMADTFFVGRISTQATAAVGSVALRWQMATLPLNASFMISNMMLQSIGKGVQATIIASARSGLFFIPSIIILSELFGLFGVEVAQSCADVCAFSLVVPLTWSVWKGMNDVRQVRHRKVPM